MFVFPWAHFRVWEPIFRPHELIFRPQQFIFRPQELACRLQEFIFDAQEAPRRPPENISEAPGGSGGSTSLKLQHFQWFWVTQRAQDGRQRTPGVLLFAGLGPWGEITEGGT